MSQSKKQIHGLKDFGRVELLLNSYARWDVILAVIIQTMTIIVDFANTNYWLALQGRGPFTVLQWQLMIAWCITRAILGGLAIVYIATRLNRHLSTRNYEQIAGDDMFFGRARIKFPWLLGCTILFSVTTCGIGSIVLLIPAIVFVFSSPYKLQSWKSDKKVTPGNVNTTDVKGDSENQGM